MSYYAGNYYKTPEPYVQSDKHAMVPGWGLSLKHAGPPMIAVGASPDGLGAARLAIKPMTQEQSCSVAFAIEKACSEGRQADASVCGQAASRAYDCRTGAYPQSTTAPGVAEDPMSTWVWVACGAIVLGAAGLFAYNKGWIGSKKPAAMTANKTKVKISKVHVSTKGKGYIAKILITTPDGKKSLLSAWGSSRKIAKSRLMDRFWRIYE